MRMYIAPGQLVNVPAPPRTFDEKVALFEAQVRGWQINIARQVIEKIPDSGFATLAIVMSYPEKIWQYRRGMSSEGKSKIAFREGMADIFPSINVADQKHSDAIDLIYTEVRCGTYHNGGPGPGVLLSASYKHSFAIVGDQIQVNPHILPKALDGHLTQYVSELRDPTNTALRANFEAMFGKA